MSHLSKNLLSLNLIPICFLTLSFSVSAGVDPIGQTASYKAVKGSRTSSMVKSAVAEVTVASFVNTPEEGSPHYVMKADYEADIRLYGRHSGTELIDVPDYYFTPEFIEKIRQDGTYEAPDFKVKHLGYENATNGNRSYQDCDHLYFYDIKTEKTPSMFNFFIAAAFGKTPDSLSSSDIQDLKVYAKVKAGIPVLGAVQIDISGKYQGIAAKAGFDYVSQ